MALLVGMVTESFQKWDLPALVEVERWESAGPWGEMS